MASALIKCPNTDKIIQTGIDLPTNFKSMGIKVGDSKISTCPYCGETHHYNSDDIFFEN